MTQGPKEILEAAEETVKATGKLAKKTVSTGVAAVVDPLGVLSGDSDTEDTIEGAIDSVGSLFGF